jgi:hypothetical protein
MSVPAGCATAVSHTFVTNRHRTGDGRAKVPEETALPSDQVTQVEYGDLGVEGYSLLFEWHSRSDLVTGW